MPCLSPRVVAAAAALLIATGLPSAQRAVEVLQPVFALAPHVVNAFEQPGTFVSTRQGHYLVLDRRAHTVHQVDPDGRAGRPMLHIGQEPGRVLRPMALAISQRDVLAVMDSPGANQRIQYFTSDGRLIGGYYLPIAGADNVMLGNQVVAGSGAMAFSGDQIWINVPAWGSLMSALDGNGQFVRHMVNSGRRDTSRIPNCTLRSTRASQRPIATAACSSSSRPVCRCSAGTARPAP